MEQEQGILAETFRPGEMQKLWEIAPTDWVSLQSRRLIDATDTRVGKRVITMCSIVQAAQLGVQMALVREVGMAYRDAQAIAREAAAEIAQLFLSPVPAGRKTILFAVARGSDSEKAKWERITPDTPVDVVDAKFGGQAWIILNVMHYVERVCDVVAARNPKRYASWLARRRAMRS